MAMTNTTVTLSAEDNKAFTYTLPDSDYGFILAPQLNVPVAPSVADNGDGTATLYLSGPATGTIDIWTVGEP